jgi:tetratricopeptide (TPR) repeat protein
MKARHAARTGSSGRHLGVWHRLGILGLVCLGLHFAEGHARAQSPETQARIQALLKELHAELQRLQAYLAHADQVLRMQVFQGALNLEEAARRLQELGQNVYRRSFTETDLNALLTTHRATTQAYFQRIEAAINASRQWPPGRAPAEWQAQARGQLQRAAQEYAAKIGREDVVPELRRANEALGWAWGFAGLPPHLDHFGGERERVLGAIPSRLSQILPEAAGATTAGPPSSGPAGPGTVAAIQPGGPPAADPLERGNALLQQGQWREALGAFDEALRATPASTDAQVGRGRALNALGDLPGARQSYETALRGRPDVQYLRTWLAELWLADGDYRRADALLQDELQRFPSAWAYSYLGTLHLLQGRQADAAQAMVTAIRLDPAIANQRYTNGSFLGGLGQDRRAVVEFSSVVLLDPNLAGAYYGLGVHAARLGATAQAIEAYEAYLQRDASSEWAQRARQELARLRGQAPVPNPAGHPPGLGQACPPGTTRVPGGCVPLR